MTRRAFPTLRPVLLAALVSWAGGCASLDRAMLGVDDNDQIPGLSLDEPPKPPSTWDKILVAGGFKKKEVSPYMRPTVPAEGQRAYDDAQRLFDAGKYDESGAAAHKLAKKYRDTVLEEDALFLEAESNYARKRYAKAQDGYAELFERFPSTRYMDRSTARLWDIARDWLQSPEVVKTAEIAPVNFEHPPETPAPKAKKPAKFELTRAVPFLPNLTDRSRPYFDTEGRALEALKSIWLNDPTGPLADDALMLTASYHLRNGDFLEADHYYGILREEYPKSPHLEDAFVLGSHVKLMSYEGAAYDGKALEQAERLKESTLKLFPQTAERERLRDELKKIADAKVDRQWRLVQYYRGKSRRERSVAVTCHALLTDFPNCKYAAEARRIWNELPREAKKDLPPLPSEPRRTAAPNLQAVPGDDPAADDGAAPSGKVKL